DFVRTDSRFSRKKFVPRSNRGIAMNNTADNPTTPANNPEASVNTRQSAAADNRRNTTRQSTFTQASGRVASSAASLSVIASISPSAQPVNNRICTTNTTDTVNTPATTTRNNASKIS